MSCLGAAVGGDEERQAALVLAEGTLAVCLSSFRGKIMLKRKRRAC